MNKLKNKLNLLKVMIPFVFKIIQFRIKVFWHKNKLIKIIVFILSIFLFMFFIYFFFLSSPKDFPIGAKVGIMQGASLKSVARQLKQEHIIRSRVAFEAFVILYGGEKRIISADYLFEERASVWEIARRVSGGRHSASVIVTIPEGYNTTEIADIYTIKLVNFDKSNFLAIASEGYLFPDTYYFSTIDDEIDAIDRMEENFEKKIAPIRSDIISSGRTEKEIIIMASVLEKEVRGDADRELISGILWKRIASGMPLQVDAAPETYKTKGLPKNPIGNPGLEAIHAAIYPKSSPYLYYLHDKEGLTHYAQSFAEHKRNIAKYLK